MNNKIRLQVGDKCFIHSFHFNRASVNDGALGLSKRVYPGVIKELGDCEVHIKCMVFDGVRQVPVIRKIKANQGVPFTTDNGNEIITTIWDVQELTEAKTLYFKSFFVNAIESSVEFNYIEIVSLIKRWS